MKLKEIFLLSIPLLFSVGQIFGQGMLSGGSVTGGLQLDAQYYFKDTTINFDPLNKSGLNSWGDILYRNNAFTAGIRFEAYQPPIIGYPFKIKGEGIPYKYVNYSKNDLSVTLGDFYEQFGNGILLRTFQDKGLGFDNALRGAKVSYSIGDKIFLKAVAGKNRFNWDFDESFIKGADAEIYLSDFIKKNSKVFWKVGGSFVDREYPPAQFDTSLNQYVDAYALRTMLQYKGFTLEGEYAYKAKDSLAFIPLSKDSVGVGYLVNAYYNTKGFGFSAQYKALSQFDFRSNPYAIGLNNFLNFVPSIGRFYSLKEFTRYPFVTTATSEQGIQLETTYSPKRGKTFLVNYTKVNDFYWHKKYYESLYSEIDWKLSKKLHGIAGYQYLDYDFILQSKSKGKLFAHIYMLDLSWKIKRKTSLRSEIQYLTTAEDHHDWIYGLLELTISPHYSFAVIDEVNMGDEPDINYYSTAISYTKGSNKFILTVGRQSEGYQCAGGICRKIPAYSGVGLTILSSF